MNKLLLVIVIPFLLLAGCKKEEEPAKENKQELKGFVEKGPFRKGSKVIITALDDNLNPTGKVFETVTQNDEGFFDLSDIQTDSRYFQISVKGFYFNEVTGGVSQSQLTINALADAEGQQSVNVNVLTHLEYKRVKYLVTTEKKSFSDATHQAQAEVLGAFYIATPMTGASGTGSLAGNNTDADILLAVSSVVLNSAGSDVLVEELLNTLAGEIEKTGSLSETSDADVLHSIETLNTLEVRTNIIRLYQSLGKQVAPGDLISYFSLEYMPENPLDNYDKNVIALGACMQSFARYLEDYHLTEALYSRSTEAHASIPQYLQPLYDHTVNPANGNINTLYSEAYKAINMYNTIAANALKSKKPHVAKLEYVTYPYLGYLYWSIMELWGDTPYITPENFQDLGAMMKISRMSTAALRADMIGRLERSVQNAFLETADFQFSREMALAVLVKLSLQAKQYDKVKYYANQIIQSNRYQLASSAELHSTSKETILGYQANAVTPNWDRTNYNQLISKGTFIHAIRYTEIILAMAEASTQLGDVASGRQYLNMVRVRNNKDGFTSTEQSAVMEAIFQETKEDLKKEGVWFSMLKRLDRAQQQCIRPVM